MIFRAFTIGVYVSNEKWFDATRVDPGVSAWISAWINQDVDELHDDRGGGSVLVRRIDGLGTEIYGAQGRVG